MKREEGEDVLYKKERNKFNEECCYSKWSFSEGKSWKKSLASES